MLVANRCIEEVAGIITAIDFYSQGRGHVFDTITRLHAGGEAADAVIVAAELRRAGLLDEAGGPAYLVTLQNGAAFSSAAGSNARVVARLADLRRAIALGGEIAEAAYAERIDPTHAARLAELATVTRADRLRLTAASDIEPLPVHWLWDGRIALGTLALLAGRESVGKSTLAYALAALITNGELPGERFGSPAGVIVVAAEDPWRQVVVPRLMAAGADLTKVFRVDIAGGIEGDLSLPADLPELERKIVAHDVALVLLDPLLSRLDAKLDTHKDAEVRRALEPLIALADRTGASVGGIIHVNKSGGTDPLNIVMASRAFTAVPRSVLFAMVSPEDEDVRLFGLAKNNLGPILPARSYRIVKAEVTDHNGRPLPTSAVEWIGTDDRTIRQAMDDASETGGKVEGATNKAAEWLQAYLIAAGGGAPAKKTKEDALAAGHGRSAVNRARAKLGIDIVYVGKFPTVTTWTLPVVSPRVKGDTPGTTETTDRTDGQLSQSFQLSDSPREVRQLHLMTETEETT